MKILLLFSLFCSIGVSAYDEMREIDLIHGIDKTNSSEYSHLSKLLDSWSKKFKVKKTKLILKETTPSSCQGYYIDNEIHIYYSDHQKIDDLESTLAHEFAHHYFKEKNKKFKPKKEEFEADRFATNLVGKDSVIKSLKTHWNQDYGSNHPSIKERIKYLKLP